MPSPHDGPHKLCVISARHLGHSDAEITGGLLDSAHFPLVFLFFLFFGFDFCLRTVVFANSPVCSDL